MTTSPSDQQYQQQFFLVRISADGRTIAEHTVLAYDADGAVAKLCCKVLLHYLGLDITENDPGMRIEKHGQLEVPSDG